MGDRDEVPDQFGRRGRLNDNTPTLPEEGRKVAEEDGVPTLCDGPLVRLCLSYRWDDALRSKTLWLSHQGPGKEFGMYLAIFNEKRNKGQFDTAENLANGLNSAVSHLIERERAEARHSLFQELRETLVKRSWWAPKPDAPVSDIINAIALALDDAEAAKAEIRKEAAVMALEMAENLVDEPGIYTKHDLSGEIRSLCARIKEGKEVA